jgi:XTP/dITP diphosphohydrolase
MRQRRIKINFATGNPDKITEARMILEDYDIEINAVDSKVREIQAASLEEIAADSAKTTADLLGESIVVEDAGLFIDSLNGFPGPYSSYVHRTVGCKGILQLMAGESDRNAAFHSAVSYCDPNSDPIVFTGETRGRISSTERSGRTFGFDPVFIPQELDGRAFSELDIIEKNRVSHRSRAFAKLASWLLAKS